MANWGGYDCINMCPCGSESTSPSTQDLFPHDFETEARELDVSPEEVRDDFERNYLLGLGGDEASRTSSIVVAAVGAAMVGVAEFIGNADARHIVRNLGLVMAGFGIGNLIKAAIA